ncbi:MAG: DMT family transporter [Desulfotalea sp.]
MKNNHKNHAIPLVLLGASMISFSGIWVTLADVPPTTSAFYRVFFGAIFLIVPALCFEKAQKLSLKDFGLIVLCGFSFCLDLIFWHKSIIYIGPGLATIIGNFQVFMLAGIGILFFKEKVLPRFYCSIPLAILGLFLLVGFDWSAFSSNYKLGIVYGILTAICYTVFLLALRKIQQKGNPFYSTLFYVSIATSVFLLPVVYQENVSLIIPDTKSFLSLISLGLFSQVIGWSIIAKAMPKVAASSIGLVLLLQPALSFVWDIVIFSRPTDVIGYCGFFITIGAIYMGVTAQKKAKTLD